jgi:hypothetical protein
MMAEKLGYRINQAGFFMEPVFYDDEQPIPEDVVQAGWTERLFEPKWDGTKWVEGLSVEDAYNREQEIISQLLSQPYDEMIDYVSYFTECWRKQRITQTQLEQAITLGLISEQEMNQIKEPSPEK